MTTTRLADRRRPAAAALGCAAILIVGAVLPGVARAGLGGAPMATPPGASVADLGHGPVAAAQIASQAAVAQTMQPATGASSPSAAAPYTVRQTTFANGTVVREYLSSSGTVFGVAWQGPRMPNLSELLGSYFTQYASTVKANRRAGRVRGPGIVAGEGLVVHSGGHMGAFTGNAWLPQALPAGVAASAIQ
jgi:hypothetical protein